MKFRTEIDVPRSAFTVNHFRKGFIAGSCFSEHIAGRLAGVKFPVTSNPLGILFNPSSIASMFERLSLEQEYGLNELMQKDGMWLSYDHHGSFSGITAEDTLAGINESFRQGAAALKESDYVVVTFGTAWIYRITESGRVAANCHKQPSAMFVRERLTVDEIVAKYDDLMRGILSGKQVLFTVSPIRHLKDGLAENSLSKSILRMAVAQIVERFPQQAFYFPSFEIMNDDLRDYRFYAEDMMHPSLQAVNYIWEKFTAFAMEPQTIKVLPKFEKLNAAMRHRVLRAGTQAAESFRLSSQALVRELSREMPEVDFRAEIEYFG